MNLEQLLVEQDPILNPAPVVVKAGRVLSQANLALIESALSALTTLVEAAKTDDGIDAAKCCEFYGAIIDDWQLPIVTMSRLGDVCASHLLRAHLDDDDLFVKVLRKSQESGHRRAVPAQSQHPAARAREVAAQLFR